MIYPLPTPLEANFTYEAVRIENMRYDGSQYVADVFGISSGQPIPLIFQSRTAGLQRITQCVITDMEIDAELIVNPNTPSRLDAGLACAMQRLYRLVQS